MNQKVGYAHEVREAVRLGRRRGFRITTTTCTQVARGTSSLSASMVQVVTVLPDGMPVQVRSEMALGNRPTVVDARFSGKTVQLTGSIGGSRTERVLDLPAGFRPELVARAALAGSGWEKGRSEVFHDFQPEEQGFVRGSITVKEHRKVEVMGKPADGVLLTVFYDPIGEMGTECVERNGETVWFESRLAGGFRYERTTEAEARKAGGTLDLFTDTLVRVTTRLPDGTVVESMKCRATLEGEAGKAFPSDTRQTVKADDEPSTVEIATRRTPIPRGLARPDGDDASQLQAFLKPTLYVEARDAAIVSLAESVAKRSRSLRGTILSLADEVFQRVAVKSLNIVSGTALETLNSGEGDCTEHTALMIALCRALGIPARAADGLKYIVRNGQPWFAYHQWTEVCLRVGKELRWLPVDPSASRHEIDATYIKVGVDSYDDQGRVSALLRQVRVIGSLKLEILDFRPSPTDRAEL